MRTNFIEGVANLARASVSSRIAVDDAVFARALATFCAPTPRDAATHVQRCSRVRRAPMRSCAYFGRLETAMAWPAKHFCSALAHNDLLTM